MEGLRWRRRTSGSRPLPARKTRDCLTYLLPGFEARYGGKVRVMRSGYGNGAKIGEKGDADVLLVHARPLENKFMASGFGSVRKDVDDNDFIIVGPKKDPAAVRARQGRDCRDEENQHERRQICFARRRVRHAPDGEGYTGKTPEWRPGPMVCFLRTGDGPGVDDGGTTRRRHAYRSCNPHRAATHNTGLTRWSKAIPGCSIGMESSWSIRRNTRSEHQGRNGVR